MVVKRKEKIWTLLRQKTKAGTYWIDCYMIRNKIPTSVYSHLSELELNYLNDVAKYDLNRRGFKVALGEDSGAALVTLIARAVFPDEKDDAFLDTGGYALRHCGWL